MKKMFNPIMQLSTKESSRLAKIMNGEVKSSIGVKGLKKMLKKGRELGNGIKNI